MCVATCLVSVLVSSKASAGPVEILDGVSINPSDPQHLIVPYHYGGGGMFVSHDGGKTYGWLCAAGVSTNAVNRNGQAFLGGDGAIYLGLFDGLMKGTGDGCGFVGVPELDNKYIASVTGDPIDPKRTYIITTNPMADNGIWMNDGGGTFKPIGSTVQNFLDDLIVVKNGDKRRFYETGAVTNTETHEVKYSVRVSDDDAMTWTDDVYDIAQFGPRDMYAEFSIVAIDPTNPDRVIARVWRKMAVDTLVVSDAKGNAGSWKLLAEPTEVDAVTYTPEGVLYFGDDDQITKALYVVDKAGDAPRMINNEWKPICLHYDAINKRLLGCSNFFLFGSVDTTTGALDPMLDLRCAEKFVECPGQMPMAGVCRPQAEVDFCSLSHWLLAPVCDVYDRGSELPNYVAEQTIMCADGLGVPKAAGGVPSTGAAGGGATGAAGSAGSSGAMSMSGAAGPPPGSGGAGAAAPSGTQTSPDKPAAKSGGCAAAPGQSRGSAALLAFLGGLLLLLRAGRRPRRG
jgi:hypothetical protein